MESGNKYVQPIVGSMFMICAAILWIIGIHFVVSCRHYNCFIDTEIVVFPAAAAIAAGFFFFSGSARLLCGSAVELKTAAVYVGALLAILVIGAVATGLNKDGVLASVSKSALAALDAYAGDNATRDQVDLVQTQWACCGATGYSDWESLSWAAVHPSAVPKSCCSVANGACTAFHGGIRTNATSEIFATGCVKEMSNFFERNLLRIMGVLVAFAIPMFLSIAFSVALFVLPNF